MYHWPTSLPDYQWPEPLTWRWMAPLRLFMASVFHAAYAIGRLVGSLLRSTENVLVIRTDGLGDALLFEPALESLARVASPARIHLWAPDLTCALLARCPTVARLMVIPRGFKQGNLKYFGSCFWRAKLGYALGRWTFSKVVYPVQSAEPLGNWLFVSASAEERWINYGDTINQFEWQRQRTQEKATRIIESRPGNAHELHRNEYLASQWSERNAPRLPKLYVTDEVARAAKRRVQAWQFQAALAGGREVIGVVPGSSMSVKSYPIDRWSAALQRLWREFRVVPAILGGPDDVAHLKQLIDTLGEVPHLSLPKPLGILEMGATIGQLDGVLSVDTGLAHIAVAQRVPTVVLVGGGHPGRFFPWPGAKQHIALNIPTPCAGCHDRCTEPEPICITHITPDEVVAAYARLKGHRVSLEVYVADQPQPTYQAAG